MIPLWYHTNDSVHYYLRQGGCFFVMMFLWWPHSTCSMTNNPSITLYCIAYILYLSLTAHGECQHVSYLVMRFTGVFMAKIKQLKYRFTCGSALLTVIIQLSQVGPCVYPHGKCVVTKVGVAPQTWCIACDDTHMKTFSPFLSHPHANKKKSSSGCLV